MFPGKPSTRAFEGTQDARAAWSAKTFGSFVGGRSGNNPLREPASQQRKTTANSDPLQKAMLSSFEQSGNVWNCDRGSRNRLFNGLIHSVAIGSRNGEPVPMFSVELLTPEVRGV